MTKSEMLFAARRHVEFFELSELQYLMKTFGHVRYWGNIDTIAFLTCCESVRIVCFGLDRKYLVDNSIPGPKQSLSVIWDKTLNLYRYESDNECVEIKSNSNI